MHGQAQALALPWLPEGALALLPEGCRLRGWSPPPACGYPLAAGAPLLGAKPHGLSGRRPA